MNQREKAREFLRREGHGAAVRDVNVGEGDKRAISHPHHQGRPQPARAHQVYSSGDLADDGLLRGHVGDDS